MRSIKRALHMEPLLCKTPAMVHKELWAHFLGYNLARKAAAQAALEHDLNPRQISFAGTVQTLEAFRDALITSDCQQRALAYSRLFEAIATHIVGDRPNRVEPRRRKRRDDRYPMLGRPRAEERARLLNGAAQLARRRPMSPDSHLKEKSETNAQKCEPFRLSAKISGTLVVCAPRSASVLPHATKVLVKA